MTMITFSCLERKNCLKIPTRFLKSSACRQRSYLMRKLKILASPITTKSCWRPNQPVCTFVDIWYCYLKTMNWHVSWSCISNQSKGLTQWLHTVELRLHSIVGEVRMRVPPDLWKWSKRQPWIFLCKDLWEWKRLTSRVQLNHTNKKIKTDFVSNLQDVITWGGRPMSPLHETCSVWSAVTSTCSLPSWRNEINPNNQILLKMQVTSV
jgi:hypothetical protein